MDAPDLKALEYPRHVHRPSVPGAWVYTIVGNPSECARALADGWSLTPILLGQTPAEPPSAAPFQSVEPPDPASAPVLKPKGGWPKGKPRKVTP